MFDVTMGCYDGADVCELVGLYLLDKLSSLIDKSQIGLTVIHNPNGPKLDKLRKEIIKIFKTEGVNITIETNLTTTDFLDVSFDLSTGEYYPFRKPNDKPLYINAVGFLALSIKEINNTSKYQLSPLWLPSKRLSKPFESILHQAIPFSEKPCFF